MHMACMDRKLHGQCTILYTKGMKLTLWVVHHNLCFILVHTLLLTSSRWSAFDLCPLPGVTPPTGRRCLCCRRYQLRPAQTAHQTQAVPHLRSSRRRLIHTRVVVAVPVRDSVCE